MVGDCWDDVADDAQPYAGDPDENDRDTWRNDAFEIVAGGGCDD